MPTGKLGRRDSLGSWQSSSEDESDFSRLDLTPADHDVLKMSQIVEINQNYRVVKLMFDESSQKEKRKLMSRIQEIDEQMGFVFANKSDEHFEMCLAEIEDEEIIQKLYDLF